MVTEEKIAQVRRQLKRGEPEGELRENLLKEGYTEEDMKIIFKPRPYDMRSWYLTFGVIITLGGVYFFSKTAGLLILLLGLLLFGAFYYEEKRLEKLKNPK